MTAEVALDKQIARYRQMKGEERLSIALNLHEMACDIAREGIRHQHPRADAATIEQPLQARIKLLREA